MIVKQADIIIKWLKANGYHEDNNGNWFREPDDLSFHKVMFKRCGKTPSDNTLWMDEWLEFETYSTIRIGQQHRAHIFDHFNNKVLCGVNRFQHPPFKINVTEFDIKEMGKTFLGYSKSRGGPNPNKFTCIKCENILEKMLISSGIKKAKKKKVINTKIKGNPDLEIYDVEFNDIEIKFTNEFRKTEMETLIHSYINKTEPLYDPNTKERMTEAGSLSLNGFWKAFDGLQYTMFKAKTRTTTWYVYYTAGTKVREAICKKHNLKFKLDTKTPTFMNI